MDYRDDELEVEIIDIDRINDEVYGESSPALVHSLLVPRLSPRQRRMQLIATISIVSLLLSLLLGSYVPVRDRILGKIIPSVPTPAAPLPEGLDQFYFHLSPPWGNLFVDGRQIAHPPSNIEEDTPLRLTKGHHVIRWVAEPFSPQQCNLSIPPDFEKDTCHYNEFVQPPIGQGGWIFNFPVSLMQLSQPYRNALITSIQSALNSMASTETVLSGEPYVTNVPTVHQIITYTSLHATLHYELNTQDDSDEICNAFYLSNTRCLFEGQSCYLLCTIQLDTTVSTQDWQVLAVVSGTWDYATTDGKVIVHDQPENVAVGTAYDHLLPLSISWRNGVWHVTSVFPSLTGDMKQWFDPVCGAELNAVTLDQNVSYVEEAHAETNWSYVSGKNLAAGCLGLVTLDQASTATPSSIEPVAYCLYRFGVLVAANNVAHTYWPTMPLADAYEQHLAQQLSVQ